ncbi:MAG: choice-of-anchor J domain-containing protein [Bacteroidetes bacterium]|nr:choice-of-anchor J domain-containing protein [Bacteroidota bacterium]
MELFTSSFRKLCVFLITLSMTSAVHAQVVFSSSGTWTCPTGVTSVTVQCWGAGGGGGGTNANPTAGSGGAGGAFAQGTVTVVPGTVYTVTVGAGGTAGSNSGGNGGAGGTSSFGANLVAAVGGAGGNGSLAGAATAAGSSTGSVGTIIFAGGDGGSATGTTASGGGGGGAGTTAAGGAAVADAGGTGGATGGGNGGNGRTGAGAGRAGTAPGGGASGGLRTSGTTRAGGTGGAGQVIIACTSCYCIPSGSGGSRYISNVTTTGGYSNLNNTTGFSAGGYADYSALAPTVIQSPSDTVNFSVSVAGASGGVGVAIFIDWNQNGVFSDPGETVYSTNGTYTFSTPTTGFFVVPSAQATGSYRIRVVTDYNSSTPDACSSGIDGESEDYTFIVGVPCLAVTQSALTVCKGQSVTLAVSGSTGGVYTWSPSTGLSATTGDTVIATPDSTVTYTVSSSGSCAIPAAASIAVNSAPAALTVSPDAPVVCSGTVVALNATGGAFAQTLLSEGFEGATFPPTGWASLTRYVIGNPWVALDNGTAHSGSGAAEYVYNSDSSAKAYLMTPGLALTANTTYTISYWEKATTTFPEKLQITAATSQTVAAQLAGTVIQSTTTYNNSSYAHQTVTFTPTISGTYYISFNCLSDRDEFYLNLDDILITSTSAATTWTPVTGLYTDSMATTPYTGATTNSVYALASTPVQYIATSTSPNGCGVSDTANLTISPAPTVLANAPTACAPATVDLTATSVTAGSTPGLTFTYYTDSAATTTYGAPTAATAGTYYIKGTTGAGCYTVVPVTVTVNTPSTTTLNQAICPSTTYTFHGQTLSASGIYYDTLANMNGCDSILILHLIVLGTDTIDVSQSICQGSGYTFNGTTYTTAGTYYATFTASIGCDSIVALTLTVNPLDTTTLSQAICAGSSYDFNGVNLTTAGTYYDTLTSVTGCDSLLVLTLTVHPLDTTTLSQTICAGSSYDFNGVNLTTAGTYYDTLSAVTGCDSLLMLNLAVTPLDTTILSQTICSGTTYAFNGSNLSASGTYYDTLTAATGCDSLLILNLTVTALDTTRLNQAICAGSSFDFNGVNLTAAGTYYDTLTSVTGCDSLLVLNLSVNALDTTRLSQTICAGSSYDFHGVNLAAAGTYYDTLTAATGCDSLLILNLSILRADTTNINQTICQGSSFDFNGVNLTAAGTYYDTLASGNGCDSLLILHLAVTRTDSTTVSASICSGSSYAGHTAAGTFTDTYTSASGCDSVRTLHLTLITATQTAQSHAICQGASYSFYGQTLTQAGNYRDTLRAVGGCDSAIVTLTLTVNTLPVPTVTNNNLVLSTQTETSYQWLLNDVAIGGATSQTYTATQNGSYAVYVTDANGCSDTSAAVAITNVGIIDVAEGFGVKLYPNPNAGSFVLTFTTDAQREIEITDIIGKVITTTGTAERNVAFNLNDAAAGIYLINIKQNGKTYALKFNIAK